MAKPLYASANRRISSSGPELLRRAAIGGVSTPLGVALSASYLSAFNDLLILNLYVMVPWTAINLVDFFIVRRGHYSVVDMFDPKGIYRAWSPAGLTAFGVGLLSVMPFMVLTFYTGLAPNALGGVDISFIVGLAVSAALYYTLARQTINVSSEAPAVARSQLALAEAFE